MVRALLAVLAFLTITAATPIQECDMGDKPFDRQVINTRERPLSSSVNQAESYMDQRERFVRRKLHDLRTSATDPAATGPFTGFLGDGYRVIPDPAGASMDVYITDGLGFYDLPADVPADIDGISRLDDLERYKPLVLTAAEPITLAAADPVNDRIDIIEVAVDRRREDSVNRDILNPATGVFGSLPVLETLSWSHDGRQGTVVSPAPSTTGIGYKQGVAAGVPVEPAVTAGYVKVATIYVDAAVAAVDADKIVDQRPMLFPNGINLLGYTGKTGAASAPLTNATVIGPPGVLIWGYRPAGATPIGLYVVAGDGSALADLIVTANAVRDTVAAIAGDYVLTVEPGAVTVGVANAATVAAALAAGVTIAEGQPVAVVSLDVRYIDSTPSSESLFVDDPAATFWINAHLLFQR